MEEEKYTQEEIEKKMEDSRRMGMEILKGYLPSLALAYEVNQEDAGFGKDVRGTVDKFLYRPTVKALDSSGHLSQALFDSRKDGKFLSGNISEEGLTEKAATDVTNAIASLKVIDLKDYMTLDIPEEYEDKYISQMFQSNDKKEKEISTKIFEALRKYFISDGIRDAYSQKAEAIPKGLEKILKEEAEKEKKSD